MHYKRIYLIEWVQILQTVNLSFNYHVWTGKKKKQNKTEAMKHIFR